jgi:tRNA pseudouridine38-40 synthase
VITRLALEYDGTDFAGWARQPGRRTVQAELEHAIATILREDVPVTVAGRTDRGVHAWGQVCSYPAEALDPVRLNALLPRDVAVLDSAPAPAGFDARRDASSRTYCYRIVRRRARPVRERTTALWVPGRLDEAVLHACAAHLVGTRDFTAFTPTETGHTRFTRKVLAARWERDGDVLAFWIEADSFMRHMNRVLVGTMLEAARGVHTVEAFAALLEGAPRSAAGATAPPHGLALASVAFEDA